MQDLSELIESARQDFAQAEQPAALEDAKAKYIGKSTVHKDVTERLAQVNPALAKQARKVLDVNKSERHIRGGLATREKYLHQH